MQGRWEASSGFCFCFYLSEAARSVLGTRKLYIKKKAKQAGVGWEEGKPLLSTTCFSRFKVDALLCN